MFLKINYKKKLKIAVEVLRVLYFIVDEGLYTCSKHDVISSVRKRYYALGLWLG